MMRAGQLRHRVQLQRQRLADDLVGGDDVSFTHVATLWADVSTIGGREFWEAKKLVPELTHQVEIRYRADVAPGMRFTFRNAVLRIHAAPDPDERRIRLLCMCTELVQ
jgi:SPP1 family predicted phage head-tail adaptor